MNSKQTTHKVSIAAHLPKGIMTKTLTQNDGFQTLTISRQYTFQQIMGEGENVADFETTKADIFVRDSMDEMWGMLDRLDSERFDYKSIDSMIHGRHHSDTKFMKSEKECISQISRKMQTFDYRNRELLIVIVRHEPLVGIRDHESFSVYCEERKALARKAEAKQFN